jgi:hypothetical protein
VSLVPTLSPKTSPMVRRTSETSGSSPPRNSDLSKTSGTSPPRNRDALTGNAFRPLPHSAGSTIDPFEQFDFPTRWDEQDLFTARAAAVSNLRRAA